MEKSVRPTRKLALLLTATAALEGAWGEAAFWERATSLLDAGKVEEAGVLARGVLLQSPDDADALVVAGTVTLYTKLQPRRDESIYRNDGDPSAPPTYGLTAEGAQAVASYWKRVPGLDLGRTYLWGDLAQLTFRAGDPAHALEYAALALSSPQIGAESLQAASQVFALNLDWVRAAQALARIPGNRTALLYQGLEAWRTGKDGWRALLKSFVDQPGEDPSGAKLAAYLMGPAMRDNEGGYQEALKVEAGIPALAVRQKYAERYPDKFLPRLGLARYLAQYGSFSKSLFHFSEIDRKGLATAPDERETVLFQLAWATQGSGQVAEAAKIWAMVVESKDFYLRSAACWFLGQFALAQGKPDEAKTWWTTVADEPARSKYAFWSREEVSKLK